MRGKNTVGVEFSTASNIGLGVVQKSITLQEAEQNTLSPERQTWHTIFNLWLQRTPLALMPSVGTLWMTNSECKCFCCYKVCSAELSTTGVIRNCLLGQDNPSPRQLLNTKNIPVSFLSHLSLCSSAFQDFSQGKKDVCSHWGPAVFLAARTWGVTLKICTNWNSLRSSENCLHYFKQGTSILITSVFWNHTLNTINFDYSTLCYL